MVYSVCHVSHSVFHSVMFTLYSVLPDYLGNIVGLLFVVCASFVMINFVVS